MSNRANQLIDRYNEIAESAGYVIASFGLEIQDKDKRIAELEAELHQERNWHGKWKRQCQALDNQVAALQAEKQSLCADIGLIEAQRDKAEDYINALKKADKALEAGKSDAIIQPGVPADVSPPQ